MKTKYTLLLLIGFIFCLTTSGYAQNQTVTGTVTNAQTGEPISSVNIVVRGTSMGTTTNADGYYKLQVSSLQDTLVFSYIGFKSTIVSINGRTEINITLKPQAVMAEELVVVGYGSKKEENLVTSVSHIDVEELEEINRTNLILGLQGSVSGLAIADHGGAPGQRNTTIRLRGVTSLNSTSPLVLVDGIPQNMSTINPRSIKDISVLKDAAATAIYGSRGANGVILITTKTGGKEGVNVSYNGSFGFQNIALEPDFATTEQYFRAYNLSRTNSGLDPIYSEKDIQAYLQGMEKYPALYPSAYNDISKYIADPSPVINQSVSIRGGGEKLTSYFNFQYTHSVGWLKTLDNTTRYQARLNSTYYVNDNIKVFTKLFVNKEDVAMTNVNFFRLFFYPINLFQGIAPDGSYMGGLSGGSSLDKNLNPDVAGVTNTNKTLYTAQLGTQIEIIEGLELDTDFSYKYNTLFGDNLLPEYTKYGFWDEDKILYRRVQNVFSKNSQHIEHYTFNAALTYDENIGGSHDITFLLGVSQDEYKMKSTFAEGQDLYSNNIRDLGASELENRLINSNIQTWGLRSAFGRVSYSFMDKYLLQVNGRYDGSSRFPAGSKYTFFPSVAIGWRISNEEFWEPISDIVNNLKLRVSYGINGNQSIGNYEYISKLNVSNNYAFGNEVVPTVSYDQLAAKNLSWEKTRQFNIGIDAGLIENKLSFTVNFYKKKTEGILLRLPIAGVVGLTAARSNAGSVVNKGIETKISWSGNSGDFTYDITANMSFNDNTLVDYAGLAPDKFGLGGTFITKEGWPINSVRGLIHLGYYQNQQEIEEGPEVVIANRPVIPGNPKFKDIAGGGPNGNKPDGKITAADSKFLGSTIPRYYYGLTFSAGYKNFDFFMKWQGGADFVRPLTDPMKGAMLWPDHIMLQAVADDYWTPNNRDAQFPTPQYTSIQTIWPSTRTVKNITYLRLRNISLGYSIPSAIIQGLGMKALRIYISAQNIFLICPVCHDFGLEPQGGSVQDFRSTYYYQSQSWKAGINIKF